MIRCELVDPQWIDAVWPDAAPILSKAIERSGGRYTEVDVFVLLKERIEQLWLAYEKIDGKNEIKIHGAVTTKIEMYPGRKLLNITFCAGDDLEEWKDEMLSEIETFAGEYECTAIEIVGRFGWEKLLADNGYRKSHVILEKDLNDVDEASSVAA